MSFRKPQTIKRLTAGGYVNGVWVDGAKSIITIKASVQSMTGEDQLVIPAGKRLSDYVKVYTSSDLQVLGEVKGLQPDRLVWRGKEYECISADVRQMGVIDHFKFTFSKVEQ